MSQNDLVTVTAASNCLIYINQVAGDIDLAKKLSRILLLER